LRKRLNVPVIGMIDPGVAYAVRTTTGQRIGVIGTRGTVSNKAYSTALHKVLPDAFVVEKACPLLVPLVEEGWIDHAVTRMVVKEYLAELIDRHIDTLILGCTHYPVLYTLIKEIMGKETALVDSGIAAADVVRSELNRIGLETNANASGRMEFYVTDIPTTFRQVAQLFLEQEIKEIVRVDLEFLKKLKTKYMEQAGV
jgi:glutamate racemase